DYYRKSWDSSGTHYIF
nr:immunoglobulin light chain junction region [Macaca mulatta]